MARKYNVSLTYKPKISGVVDGTITQTIRKGCRYNIGDWISFHGWEGRPYQSKWNNRTPYFKINSVSYVWLRNEGIAPQRVPHAIQLWEDCNIIAERDGIVPPTGAALKSVVLGDKPLRSGHCIEAQIIRWNPLCRLCTGIGGGIIND